MLTVKWSKIKKDSGGSCSPSYRYQWQYSLNRVSWTDIPLATDSDLTIDSALTQSAFYRRKVTEISSGSIGYSDVASVFVMVQEIDTTASTSYTKNPINGNNKSFYDKQFGINNNQILYYDTHIFALTQKQQPIVQKVIIL